MKGRFPQLIADAHRKQARNTATDLKNIRFSLVDARNKLLAAEYSLIPTFNVKLIDKTVKEALYYVRTAIKQTDKEIHKIESSP